MFYPGASASVWAVDANSGEFVGPAGYGCEFPARVEVSMPAQLTPIGSTPAGLDIEVGAGHRELGIYARTPNSELPRTIEVIVLDPNGNRAANDPPFIIECDAGSGCGKGRYVEYPEEGHWRITMKLTFGAIADIDLDVCLLGDPRTSYDPDGACGRMYSPG
jgi:hypothetical protein